MLQRGASSRLIVLAVAVAVAVAVAGVAAPRASAHAGLISSDPAAGTALGASPTAIRLSFSERPDASLSTIRVLDGKGTEYQAGSPELLAGDPLSLVVPVRPLARGVYTVSWRVDSAVDGHATTGAYSFGVQVAPGLLSATPRSTTSAISSPLELVARWILLVGLVLLIGAATAGVGRFGGSAGRDLLLPAGGCAVSIVGLLVLAAAQRSNASTSLGTLLHSPVGHALVGRGVAIGAAGVALLIAWRAPRVRRLALLAVGLAAVAAVVVHVANGHAAAASWPSALTVIAQSTHFAVAGMWLGGLAALLVGVRGQPSEEKVVAVRRFSAVAVAGLVLVVTTGVVRAFSELRAWGELFSTGYGRAVLVKLALVALMAGLGLRNRRRSVPAAAADLGPLRRTSAAELVLAATALAVAALLGTLAPPVSASSVGVPGLSATGADSTRSVRARLSALSDQPGPNRFVAHVDAYDSGTPVRGASVTLRFTPLDDPGVAPTSLALAPSVDGSYAGSGDNMMFDGRWGVDVLVQRGRGAAEVPLELDPVGPEQSISIERIPGQDPKYTKFVGNAGFIRISPHPERAGSSELFVTSYTAAVGDEQPIDQLVVTLASGDGPTQQQNVRRLGKGSFVSNLTLAAGRNTIDVVAHARTGARLRSVFDLQVPGR